jgi:hypothetical protein
LKKRKEFFAMADLPTLSTHFQSRMKNKIPFRSFYFVDCKNAFLKIIPKKAKKISHKFSSNENIIGNKKDLNWKIILLRKE